MFAKKIQEISEQDQENKDIVIPLQLKEKQILKLTLVGAKKNIQNVDHINTIISETFQNLDLLKGTEHKNNTWSNFFCFRLYQTVKERKKIITKSEFRKWFENIHTITGKNKMSRRTWSFYKNVHSILKLHPILMFFQHNSVLSLIRHKSRSFQNLMDIADEYLSDINIPEFMNWDVDHPPKFILNQ